MKLVCIGDNIKLSTSYVTAFKQRRSVDMTIVHYCIVKTETVVITIHVTIFLQEVMLMGALCVKSFIQIIFRRNMLICNAIHTYFHTGIPTYQNAFDR